MHRLAPSPQLELIASPAREVEALGLVLDELRELLVRA